MDPMGHEDAFPRPRLSARYVIRKQTVAATRGNGLDPPIPAVHGTAIEPRESTQTRPSRPASG